MNAQPAAVSRAHAPRKLRVLAMKPDEAAKPAFVNRFLYGYEQAIFDHFKFDPVQFDKRVQLDVEMHQHPGKSQTFNTEYFKYYFVPMVKGSPASASKAPSASNLKAKLNELNYISSNPTIAFFRMDKASQDAVRKNDASEFARVPEPSSEEIRHAIWNDLIHSATRRALTKPSSRSRAAPAAGGASKRQTKRNEFKKVSL